MSPRAAVPDPDRGPSRFLDPLGPMRSQRPRRNRPPTEPETMHTLRGIAVSSGIAIGPVQVFDPHGPRLPHRAVAAEDVARELDRLERGLETAFGEAQAAEAEARARLGPQYADILGRTPR